MGRKAQATNVEVDEDDEDEGRSSSFDISFLERVLNNVMFRNLRLPQALLYKPYSYCKTKLGCQVQNVLGDAFQVDNRWRSVQVSSVHFRGKSLLKMTIILFTRAPTCCVSFIHSKY